MKRYHRRTLRLPNYDYRQNGAYFVTICTQGHVCLFGKIVDGKMHTNVYANTVIDSWRWLDTQHPYVDLDHFVLMPNHLHGIILIDDMRDADKMRRGGSRTAPTAESVKRKPLGRLIGAFKTVSTKQINLLRNTPRVIIWQRSFFDRIIRNENELNRIREYIHFNPLKWNQDKENPENPKIP